jgi:hypothetical protein
MQPCEVWTQDASFDSPERALERGTTVAGTGAVAPCGRRTLDELTSAQPPAASRPRAAKTRHLAELVTGSGSSRHG